MKPNIVLAIASLLTVILGTFHLADDINRGMSPGGLPNLAVVVVGAVWLCATFILVGRRSGSKQSRLSSSHPRRIASNDGCSPHPPERTGGRLWHPPQRRVVLHLDAARTRRDRALLRCPLAPRTVERSSLDWLSCWKAVEKKRSRLSVTSELICKMSPFRSGRRNGRLSAPSWFRKLST